MSALYYNDYNMNIVRPLSTTGRSEAQKAFTLVELLVVLAIIGLVAALLFPVLGNAQARSREAQCANNLKKVHVLVTLFASDRKGVLPPSNTANPNTIKNTATLDWLKAMKDYMDENDLSKEVWYCPSLMRQDEKNRSTEGWDNNWSEVWIGYNYLGNPTEISVAYSKYVGQAPYGKSKRLLTGEILATDICETRDSSTNGAQVATWTTFPHDRPKKPVTCNRLIGDGHVERAPLAQTQLRFRYDSGRRLFW